MGPMGYRNFFFFDTLQKKLAENLEDFPPRMSLTDTLLYRHFPSPTRISSDFDLDMNSKKGSRALWRFCCCGNRGMEAKLSWRCVELTKFWRLSGFWAKENGSKEREQTPAYQKSAYPRYFLLCVRICPASLLWGHAAITDDLWRRRKGCWLYFRQRGGNDNTII